MDISSSTPLLLLGAGKMGSAMLTGWIARGLPPARVVAVDPSPPPEVVALLAEHGIRHFASVPPAEGFRLAVVAVKPQMMATALPALAPALSPDTAVISIAAGTPVAAFEAALGARPVVRAMPNTPAQVGRGVTVCFGNERVGPALRAAATDLLAAVGQVDWIDDEGLIDAVTAVSGSGPAYAFLLAEVMAQAGAAAGLPLELAARIARATVAGAGALMDDSDLPAATLRQNVTSPGGTTAAALAVLMDEGRGLPPLMVEAVAAATRRGRELAG